MKAKRMRLPNGFGRITKISNKNLRNPYRAMVTIGFGEDGRPIGKILKPQGYFRTYNDAYQALMEYHKDPIDLSKTMTVAELYNQWSTLYFKKATSHSSEKLIKAAWAYLHPYYKMRVTDVRAKTIRESLDNAYKMHDGEQVMASANIKQRIKLLWVWMLDYAVEYEIVEKNWARMVKYEIETKTTSHISFTKEEMDILWKYQDDPCIGFILIECYTGWRPSELLDIKLEDVDINEMTMKGGMKTKAGKDRIVPIHSKIQDLVKNKYNESLSRGSEWLISIRNGHKMTYDYLRKSFVAAREQYGLDTTHRPHDARKQFVTMAKAAGVDEYAIKRIVGHAINDITEGIYTDRSIDWLRSEIEKINV